MAAQSHVEVLGFVALAFLPGADIVHNNINNLVSCASGIRKMRWIVQYTLLFTYIMKVLHVGVV